MSKWFYTGPKLSMDIGKGVAVDYVAFSQEGFRELTKGSGVKERAFLKWLRDTGRLLPKDAKHNAHEDIPDHGAVANYRFRPGVFGPGPGD